MATYFTWMDTTSKGKLEVPVKIYQQNMKLKLLDIGESIRIIDQNSWKQLNSSNIVQLQSTVVKVYDYGASNSLKLLRQFQCLVETEQNKTISCFQIAKDITGNLLTWKTGEDLIISSK